VLQVFMLGLLWFTCVFCVGMVQLSWVEMGPVALVVYVFAAVPFLAAVLRVLPNALTDIFIAASISSDFDDDLITKSVNGQYDLRQVEEEEEEDENSPTVLDPVGSGHQMDEPDHTQGEHRRFVPGKDSRSRGLDSGNHLLGDGENMMADDDGDFDDEVDAPLDQVALGLGASGAAPLRVQGVPPSSTGVRMVNGKPVRPGQFVWGEKRPIFSAPMGNVEL
jgi:hypothetical protein